MAYLLRFFPAWAKSDAANAFAVFDDFGLPKTLPARDATFGDVCFVFLLGI
jgi:hypothetical protein